MGLIGGIAGGIALLLSLVCLFLALINVIRPGTLVFWTKKYTRWEPAISYGALWILFGVIYTFIRDL